MHIEDLRTPAFLIEQEVLRRNIQAMSEKAKGWGVRLRPHVKTHKTLEAAALQTEAEFGGITVSTLMEAEFYLEGGFDDITYAFPIGAQKLEAAARLSEQCTFHIVVDHGEQIKAVIEFAKSQGQRFSVLLKVNCGYNRCGIEPSHSSSVKMAVRLDRSKFVDFEGILSHSGNAYDSRDIPKARKISRKECETMAKFAGRLSQEGVECMTVSVGSTPALAHAESVEGVSEVRPGNYIFFDKFQSDIGSCTLDDCAATVLTTVVSHYRHRNEMLIDAGALALSKDSGATHVAHGVVYGASAAHPHLKITRLSQEHAIATADSKLVFDRFPIGSRLRIIPNHSCLTAACFPQYYVVKGDQVVDRWRPVRGW